MSLIWASVIARNGITKIHAPTNSILTDNQQTPVTDLAGFWVGMVIMILLMLSLAGASSYRYYKSIQQSVYAPQESSGEDMSILNNGVTTSV